MKLLLMTLMIVNLHCLDVEKEKALIGLIDQIEVCKQKALAGLKIYYEDRKIGDLNSAITQTEKAYESLKSLWNNSIKDGIIGDVDIVQHRVSELMSSIRTDKNGMYDAYNESIKRQIDFLLWLSDHSGVAEFKGDFPRVYFPRE